MTHRFIILFLLLASMAQAAISLTPTNVHILQRSGAGRTNDINLLGSSNPWEAIGFNGTGVLTTLPLFDMTPSTGRSVGKILAVASGGLTLEWITSPFGDGDYGDITVGSGGTLMNIDAGAIVNADINAAAAIALSKLATDPLARANHTGTQLLSTISDAGTLAGLSAVASAQITDGTIVNADVAAGAAIAASKIADLGTTVSGTQASPITTNPLSPTWTTQDRLQFYGANGQINLPGVSGYAGKTLFIYVTGSFTVTVDPNGSEIVVEAGISLGAGVADVIAGAAGTFVGYVCDGSRWIKLESVGGPGSGFPLTANADLAGFNLFNGGAISATTLSASGAITGLTLSGDLDSDSLPDTMPARNYEKITTAAALEYTKTPIAATTGSTITIDVTKTYSVITLNEATETIAFSGTPPEGTPLLVRIIPHTADCVVTTPSVRSLNLNDNRLGFIVRQNTHVLWQLWRSDGSWLSYDPIELGDLPAHASPTDSFIVETFNPATGASGRSTRAQLLNNAAVAAGTATTPSAGDNDTSIATTAFVHTEVDATANGSWAAPYTTASTLSPTWSGPVRAVYMGVAQTVALPDAAAYAHRGIVVYSTGSFVLTVDPDSDDFIVRDGTAQADGVTITVTAAAGNYVCLISDGANWITLGYKGTLAQGS
jgi:hypothetical protein